MATPGGLVDKQELIDAQVDTVHLGNVANSVQPTSTSRTGVVHKTLTGLEADYDAVVAGFVVDGDAAIDTFNTNSQNAIDTFNTNSQNAIDTFNTNSQNAIDTFNVNGDAAIDNINQQANNIVYSVGFTNVGTFGVGETVQSAQETLTYDGEEWAVTGVTFPYTTTGATPSADPATWRNVTIQERKMVARAYNVDDSEVIFHDDTITLLDAIQVIYDRSANQKAWLKPSSVPAGATIASVAGDQLTYNPGAVTVTMVEVGFGSYSVQLVENEASLLASKTYQGGELNLQLGMIIALLSRKSKTFRVELGTPDGLSKLDVGVVGWCATMLFDLPYVAPSHLGATVATADNATAIQEAYNLAAANRKKLLFDELYPTQTTLDFSIANMVVEGVSRGKWRDADGPTDTSSGVIYTGAGDIIQVGVGSQTWRGFKIRSADGLNTNGIHLNGIAATLLNLKLLRIQNNGGAGIAITGDNAGESCLFDRVESSGNTGSGLFLARTDTTCNNLTLSKVNFHRNSGDGCNFSSGVQKLTITDGCDFTLNVISGVAFRSSVDFDCVISDNWFENNTTDILLDCDTAARGVTSKNNSLAEATNEAIYCKNGRIKSLGDKFRSTPVGVRFDVSDFNSIVVPGQAASVASILAGNTTRLVWKPYEEATFQTENFVINNVPASQTNQLIPIKGIAGHFVSRIPQQALFYKIEARLNGVTVTAGSMTIEIVKQTSANVETNLNLTIDAVSGNLITNIARFGSNSFTSTPNYDNYFLKYTTTADWDGVTGFVDINVVSLVEG